ncbi:MAG: ribonuclease HIII [Bacilli bacterium]|nr:ribonuclease HIII [Bacilli bacterium]
MKSKQKTIVIKVSDQIKEEMIREYAFKRREKTPPYAIFQADDADTVITLYESGKAMFQGISADIDASLWKQREAHLNPIENTEEQKKVPPTETGEICPECGHNLVIRNGKYGEFTACSNYPRCTYIKGRKEKKITDTKKTVKDYYNITSIGSDEVGTGDFFGPIVVTASYVTKEDIPFLESLGVKDSKKMSDETILKIVPEIMKKIKYESAILTNEEYNTMYSSEINMNTFKALLHNEVLYKLKNNVLEYDYIILDQFVNPRKYYEYLKNEENVVRDIEFMTKAEDKNLAVACGSLISRYTFLIELEKLGAKYDMFLPKGASNLVDEFGVKFVKKFGFDELNKVAKLNFKNVEKIKELN